MEAKENAKAELSGTTMLSNFEESRKSGNMALETWEASLTKLDENRRKHLEKRNCQQAILSYVARFFEIFYFVAKNRAVRSFCQYPPLIRRVPSISQHPPPSSAILRRLTYEKDGNTFSVQKKTWLPLVFGK